MANLITSNLPSPKLRKKALQLPYNEEDWYIWQANCSEAGFVIISEGGVQIPAIYPHVWKSKIFLLP
jgi:hypothetical protein